MSTPTWESAPEGEFQAGETYRLRFYVRLPYTAVNVALLKAAVTAKLSVHPVTIVRFDHAAPVWSAHAGVSPFPFICTFKGHEPGPSQAGLDPRGLLALVAVIAIAAAAVYIIEGKVERLVTSTGGAVADTVSSIGKTVFDPTVLIAVTVGLFLFLRRK